MARVNRTTGILLTVMVLLLVGTVAGSFHFVPPSKPDEALPDDTRRPDAFGRGRVDNASGVSTPVPGVPAGVIASVDVKEGEEVKAGRTLYKLDDRLAQEKLHEAKLGVLAAQKHQLMAKQAAAEFQSKLRIQRSIVATAKTTWEQVSKIYLKKKKTNDDLKGMDTEVMVAELEVRKAAHAHEIAVEALNEMERNDPSQNAIELADLEFKKAELAVKAAERLLEQHVVKAPCNGFIAHLDLNVGEQFPSMPNAMQPRPKIVFLPDAPLIVRADIEQSRARYVQPGMPVTIRDHDPSNDQAWEGEVVSLSRWVIRPKTILIEPDQINDARSREVVIRLKCSPAEFPFVVGADVRVQIHIEKK